MKYELAIAHRVCPVLAKSAIGFSSKRELVAAGARSLCNALAEFGGRVKLFVILDGCPTEYQEIFSDAFSQNASVDMELVETASIGNFATYARQLELLGNFDKAEMVYFSEDDYLYRQDAFVCMAEFLRNDGVDFVTPLDHPDRYNGVLEKPRKASIRVSSRCHWRSAGTTCLTFMTRRQTLIETFDLLASYGKGAMDGTMWLGITKEDVFRIRAVAPALLAFLFRRRGSFAFFMPLCAWRHHSWRLLRTRRYWLWQPIPSLAVHLSSASLPLHADEILEANGIERTVDDVALKYLGVP